MEARARGENKPEASSERGAEVNREYSLAEINNAAAGSQVVCSKVSPSNVRLDEPAHSQSRPEDCHSAGTLSSASLLETPAMTGERGFAAERQPRRRLGRAGGVDQMVQHRQLPDSGRDALPTVRGVVHRPGRSVKEELAPAGPRLSICCKPSPFIAIKGALPL